MDARRQSFGFKRSVSKIDGLTNRVLAIRMPATDSVDGSEKLGAKLCLGICISIFDTNVDVRGMGFEVHNTRSGVSALTSATIGRQRRGHRRRITEALAAVGGPIDQPIRRHWY